MDYQKHWSHIYETKAVDDVSWYQVRPETSLAYIQQTGIASNAAIIDVGSGASTLVDYLVDAHYTDITLLDLSAEALEIAKENSQINNVTGKINFILSDMFSNISEQKFDIIISNPPYIAEKEFQELEKELLFEPRQALVAKEEGLFFYKQIADNAKNYLNQNGLITVELNANIPDAVTRVFTDRGYKKIKIIKDYSGLERVLVLKNG